MNRIKLLRKEKNIKQIELANMLNVTQASVSLWETNKTKPNEDEKLKLCEIFNCTPDYLMGYSDINLKDNLNKSKYNKIIVIKRDDTNQKEYKVSDKEMNAIITLLNTMND